jgi:hypothetical protein
MSDSERLLTMSEALGTPVQISAGDGAIRSMADRVENARTVLGTVHGSLPSCGGVAGGWGN